MIENHSLLIGIKTGKCARPPRKNAGTALLPLLCVLAVASGLFWFQTRRPAADETPSVSGEADYRAGKKLFAEAQSTADYVKAANLIGTAARQGNPKAQTA